MIEFHNIRYTGRGFEGAVVLPSGTGPLSFQCRVDGPMALKPHQVQKALLSHAVRQRTR